MVHLDESINTLKFAQRAKKIKNKVHANALQSPAEMQQMIRQLKLEIESLKAQMKGGVHAIPGHLDDQSE